jgi:hypothetical protein
MIEIGNAYKRLIDLVISKYNEFEETHPRLVKLAKGFARHHGDSINDLCYHLPNNRLPIHVVDGQQYPHIGMTASGIVPLWALYLPKASEALELMDELK